MARVEDILLKMMRRLDTSDDHAKEIRGDLANVLQKVDAHVILIKHLDLQMAQLSITVIHANLAVFLATPFKSL